VLCDPPAFQHTKTVGFQVLERKGDGEAKGLPGVSHIGFKCITLSVLWETLLLEDRRCLIRESSAGVDDLGGLDLAKVANVRAADFMAQGSYGVPEGAED
jgi:hypothetical protein